MYGQSEKRRRSIDEYNEWQRSSKLPCLNGISKARSRATIHGSEILTKMTSAIFDTDRTNSMATYLFVDHKRRSQMNLVLK